MFTGCINTYIDCSAHESCVSSVDCPNSGGRGKCCETVMCAAPNEADNGGAVAGSNAKRFYQAGAVVRMQCLKGDG